MAGVDEGRSTIYDIARVAGLAPSTVSRAFSRPGRVNPATVQMIMDIAREMGYHPNRTARGLSTGRSGNVALLVPNIGNPFFTQFMRAFHSAARESGYSVFLIDTDERVAEELRGISSVSSQADGVVLVSPRMSMEQLREVTAVGKFVVIHRQMADVACAWVDSREALHEAISTLRDTGHRAVVYLRGPEGGYSDRIRRRTVRSFCRELDIDLHFTDAYRSDRDSAEHALALCGTHGATAIMAHSDSAAIVVLSLCRERGIDVPGDLSVIGHDDIEFASAVYPALTTISAGTVATGRWAAQTLVHLIEQDGDATAAIHPPSRTAEAVFVRRGSIGPASFR